MQARNEEENADGQPNLTLFALCMFYTFSPPYLVHTLTVDACALLNAYLLLYIIMIKRKAALLYVLLYTCFYTSMYNYVHNNVHNYLHLAGNCIHDKWRFRRS